MPPDGLLLENRKRRSAQQPSAGWSARAQDYTAQDYTARTSGRAFARTMSASMIPAR
jgi:hypothetical protein